LKLKARGFQVLVEILQAFKKECVDGKSNRLLFGRYCHGGFSGNRLDPYFNFMLMIIGQFQRVDLKKACVGFVFLVFVLKFYEGVGQSCELLRVKVFVALRRKIVNWELLITMSQRYTAII
jgi:hypothetical protein